MKPHFPWSRCLVLLSAATLSMLPVVADAQERARVPRVTIQAADPTERGDGTLSPAAAAAIIRGPLPASTADVALKAAANRAHAEALRSGEALRPAGPTELAPAGGPPAVPAAPIVVNGLNVAGLTDPTSTPPDTTGAIGRTRFIQLVNRRAGIFNRNTGALINSGTLNDLAAAAANNFDPQVIWDPTTNRFYYAMDTVFSSTDNRLSVGFSKTASPDDLTDDWCHYNLSFGARFPDYPKLGDSRFFFIIGVNSFQPDFVGSDLVAISKPPAGTTCPTSDTFKVGTKFDLRDSSDVRVFTPVPANQIDVSNTGYVVARNLSLPSNKLWFFNVRRDAATGFPIFGNARQLNVTHYTVPPNASQPSFTQTLDTLDARPTQAVQATNPDRGTFSFWTQHTVDSVDPSTGASFVRWYEIDPVPAKPVVLRSERIRAPNTFLFNAAISPDRRSRPSGFGDSFVIEYNVSSSANGINPRIVAGSSVSGGAFSSILVRNGVGPYRDFSCPNSGDICRWGDYSAATPDPSPPSDRTRLDRGVVWGTNQFSGVINPPTGSAEWRTRIFALQP